MTAQSVFVHSAGKDIRLPMMLFASILGHIVAFVFVIVVPSLLSGGRTEPFGGPPGGGNVVWGTFDQGGKEAAEKEPAPARYIKKEIEEEVPLESKTTMPEPQKPKKKEPPAAKETLNQPERKTEGPYGTGKDTKAQKPGTGKTGLGVYGQGPGGAGGFGTGTGEPFPFPWYVENVLSKLELSWTKPYIADNSQELSTVIYFVITRTGDVKSVQVEKSSGFALLDRSVEAAVWTAKPFPPLPNQWTKPDLAFRVTFFYNR